LFSVVALRHWHFTR